MPLRCQFYRNSFTYLGYSPFQYLHTSYVLHSAELCHLFGAPINPVSLNLTKLKGGLGLPNFSSYYYAAQLSQLPKYHSNMETPLWVAVESVDIDPISVAIMLWLQPKDRVHISNPITKHCLAILDKFNQSSHNPLLSFIKNPAFYPA